MDWTTIALVLVIIAVVLIALLLALRAVGRPLDLTTLGAAMLGRVGGADAPRSPPPVLVHVLGVPGSGKTHLLKQLQARAAADAASDTAPGSGAAISTASSITSSTANYVLIDTDDIALAAYANVRPTPQHAQDAIEGSWDTHQQEKVRLLNERIHAAGGRPIVVAGMTANVKAAVAGTPYALVGYVLRADDDHELGEWFRRAVRRDYNKLTTGVANSSDGTAAIINIIDKAPPATLGDDIEMALGGVGLSIPAHWAPYRRSYYDMLKFEPSYLAIRPADLLKRLTSP